MSLIELLIVLFITAILGSLALPSYRALVLLSGRAEAKRELLAMASDQERYFSRFATYLDDATPLESPAQPGRQRSSAGARYTLSVTACADGELSHCFVATATPNAAQQADVCTSLSLDSWGRKAATVKQGDEQGCWLR